MVCLIRRRVAVVLTSREYAPASTSRSGISSRLHPAPDEEHMSLSKGTMVLVHQAALTALVYAVAPCAANGKKSPQAIEQSIKQTIKQMECS